MKKTPEPKLRSPFPGQVIQFKWKALYKNSEWPVDVSFAGVCRSLSYYSIVDSGDGLECAD